MLFDIFLLSAAVLLNGRTVAAQGGTPCQIVSSMSLDYASAYPEETQVLVPAKEAADCLKSVPINVEEDKALIQELQLYLNWQSNLAYLKDPPEGSTEQRSDVAGALKKIAEDLDKGVYEDEYTLQLDMRLAFDKTYDFHLNWNPDILNVFTFRRGNIGSGLADEFALVSISSDGKALPELYNYYDIMWAEEQGWTPSPVVKINNQTAEKYIEDWSANSPYNEAHARYQKIFRNQASDSLGLFITSLGWTFQYDGEYTTVEHKNGTSWQYLNTAQLALDGFDYVEDGETFFAQFCNLGPPRSSGGAKRDLEIPYIQKRGSIWRDELMRKEEVATKVKRQIAEPTALGYPTAELLHSEAKVGGYYLTGQGYEDVAVLSIPDFGPSDHEQFQDLVGQFLQTASSAGKKKLVIDLRANGGGSLFLAYDTFKQLFPSREPYGATRFRANPAFDIAGQFLNAVIEQNDLTYERALRGFRANGPLDANAVVYHSMFNYRVPLTLENKNFTSWEQLFGPHQHNGDNFTTVARWDLNNFFSDDLSLDVTGYASRKDKLNAKQPFEAEDIVMLTDGACGSTCAIFAEFAKIQGGVQTIVVGGKPETGPMQGVSGSKGSEVLTFADVRSQALVVYSNLPDKQEQLNQTEIGDIVFAHRPLLRTLWSSPEKTASRINLRDHIRMNDKNEVPLEFVYEAADCRLFYTADMVRDVQVVWKKTVDAQWGDKEMCVEGSTGQKSSLSGGQKTADQMDGWKPGNKKGAATRLGGDLRGAVMAAVMAVVAMMIML